MNGDIVCNGDVGVNGDLFMGYNKAIKVNNINPVDNETAVSVNGDLFIDPAKTIFVDSITPHLHLDTPVRVQVNGDLSVGSSDIHAENVNSNAYVKTKYLEATAGAVSNQIGVTSDLAMLNSKKLKVDSIGTNASNKVTIADNVEIQGTLTITGQTTITTGTASNVYSKAEVDQTFANLIDSAPVALNTLKELASALGNDANYATTVQNQLAGKASLANPSFVGTVTTPYLTVSSDATVNGNLSVIGTNTVITAKKIQAAPSSNLNLSGIVVLDSYFNAPIGATLGDTTVTSNIGVNGNATIGGTLVVGTTNVMSAINNISLTTGPTGPQGPQGVVGVS